MADHVAAYGLLMAGEAGERTPDVSALLEDRGRCRIRGLLYDLGAFPGLVAGEGAVEGQLYELIDPSAFSVIDAYEGFDPARPEDSLYLRRAVRLIDPADLEAWVYVYNRPVEGRPLIASGDWRRRSSRAR